MKLRQHPRVSVVVCVYNGARFLRETLDSAFAQSMPDFEVLAVDDGSTDGSPELLESFNEPRLRVIRREHAGVGATLNAGLDAAVGEFVAFLDQDDLWAAGKLEAHCRFFDECPDIDLTFSWYRLVDEKSGGIGVRPRRSYGRFSYGSLLRDYVIGPTSTTVMRRGVLRESGPVDPVFGAYYDVDLFLRAALLRPGNVAVIPQELTMYRRHSGQMSRNWRALSQEWRHLLDKLHHIAPDETASAEAQADANMTRYFSYLAYEERDFSNALHLLLGSLRRSPAVFLGDSRNWMAGAASLSGLLVYAPLHRKMEHLTGLSSDAGP